MNPESDVYKIYTKKCGNPISFREFSTLWKKGVDVLTYMVKKSEKIPFVHNEPYIATEIDKNFVLYQEVKSGNIVSNVWTREEYSFLLGGKG